MESFSQEGKSFWNSHTILYRLDKAPALLLFMPFHFLNASCGLPIWFLEKSCPRPICKPTIISLSFVPTSDYLLSFLGNHNFINSVTQSGLCPQPLPTAPSSQQPDFHGPPADLQFPAPLSSSMSTYSLAPPTVQPYFRLAPKPPTKINNDGNFSQFKFMATNFNWTLRELQKS